MHRDETNPNKKGQCNQAAENAGKERETGSKTQGKSEAITSFSSPGSAALTGGTAGSAATGLSAGSGPRPGKGGKTGSAITEENGAS